MSEEKTAAESYLEQAGKGTKKVVKREFVQAEDMKYLAQEIIREKKIDVHPAKIDFLTVEPNISKSVAARCVKSSKELKFYSGYDYVIEVSGELWNVLDKPTKEALLETQLRKILVLQNDKTGDWAFKMRKYDMVQFSKVVAEYGPEWTKRVKLCLSSLYNMTPSEEDNVKI